MNALLKKSAVMFSVVTFCVVLVVITLATAENTGDVFLKDCSEAIKNVKREVQPQTSRYRNVGLARWVWLGEYDISTDTDEAQPEDFKISATFPYSEYRPPSVYNNTALIKSNGRVKFNQFIRPACLHTSADVNASRYIVTRWGNTMEDEYQGDSGGPLQTKDVQCTFSVEFGVSSVFGVYTKVSAYVDWIEKNVWSQK